MQCNRPLPKHIHRPHMQMAVSEGGMISSMTKHYTLSIIQHDVISKQILLVTLPHDLIDLDVPFAKHQYQSD